MKELQIINQQEVLGKSFKVYGDVENPLFLAKDVAEWIDYNVKNTYRLLNQVDEEEKTVKSIHTLGGTQEAWFLTEDGLYEVLMQSRKPIAKQFKKEVKKILKQMRLTGGAVLDEEKFIKQYFPSFSEDVKQAMVLDLKHQNELYRQQLEEQQPKVEAYDDFISNDDTFGFRELVKYINEKIGKKITENQVREYLKKEKLYVKQGNKYVVSQECVRRGFGVLKDNLVNGINRPQSRFTFKLRDNLIEVFKMESKMLCPNCGELLLSEDVDAKTQKFYGEDSMPITEWHRKKASHIDVPRCEYVCPKCGYIFEADEVTLMDRLDECDLW